MVVPVLMTSCQVSEKLNNGPVIAHTMMVANARANTHARPTSRDVIWAMSEKSWLRPDLLLLATLFAMGLRDLVLGAANACIVCTPARNRRA